MLWEVELRPRDGHDRSADEPRTHGYLLAGDFGRETAERLAGELLCDPIVESAVVTDRTSGLSADGRFTVLPKPGVMDPTAQSVTRAAADLGVVLRQVRTFRRYARATAEAFNPAVEMLVESATTDQLLGRFEPAAFQLVTVPLRELDDAGLADLSRRGQLALSADEMRAVRAHFRGLGRDPTDVELETVAQTWSEHCSHKTLKGRVHIDGRTYENLLKETIFAATQKVRELLGDDDWCVSVFEDNAGIVRFDENFNVCFKVETHNHPSAIEPYGGANTGLGGVIRDVLGAGLGAKPVANTDVFCFAPPDYPAEKLPPGVLHPLRVMRGVVAGVRDYGNRMGIPTVNGAIVFDDRYLANPLVYCGTVGVIPADKCHKRPRPGDKIVALGGRTGRDGIHGATFSSLELTDQSEQVSGGAVQIGNPITQKKLHDVLLQARDRNLFTSVTDCGAGGFSSAVGEMAAELGAVVRLDAAPLKYDGLTYAEIWISESQERMVLAVPPRHWPELELLCRAEDVEAVVLGEFTDTGRLVLTYRGVTVGDLDLKFLHDGRPKVERTASPPPSGGQPPSEPPPSTPPLAGATDVLKKILALPGVASKEAVVRQYDHEVQGGTVIKPLVGACEDGPGDAAVVTPVRGSFRGVAIGCGINPRYGDLDPYAMAAAAIDEAVRNVVAVGADPDRIALLDNFCWGDTADPVRFWGLVRAAEACADAAVALRMPFISGKDSLNNVYRTGGKSVSIPGTLLISALGLVPDVRRCVTMDLKAPQNLLMLIGSTGDEFGGSAYFQVTGRRGGRAPAVDWPRAGRLYRALHAAIVAGAVRSCHDLSEGGLAVAAAEMAFAGGVGADLIELGGDDEAALFAESPTRWLIEVEPPREAEVRELFDELPIRTVGRTVNEPRLRIAGAGGEWRVWAALDELKSAWQTPLGV